MHCINQIPSGFIYCTLDYLWYTLLGDFSACCHANSPWYQEPGSPRLLFFHPCWLSLCHHGLVALQEQTQLRI